MLENARTIKLKDGRLIGFSEYGDPHGIPIFYFHGFPGSRLEASRFHEIAAKNHWRLIGIDRPGMGLSSPYKNRKILDWATDVESVANFLKIEKFSILGHSGGALFVIACAYAIPNRLKNAIIVSGMAPFEIPESKINMPRGQKIANKIIKYLPWLSTPIMWLTKKLNEKMLKNPKMLNNILKQLPAADQAALKDPVYGKITLESVGEAFRNGVGGAAQELRLVLNPWGFKLEDIKHPIMIWHGKLDTQVPVNHANIYASKIPHSQLNIIEQEGHHSLLKNHMEEILKSIQT